MFPLPSHRKHINFEIWYISQDSGLLECDFDIVSLDPEVSGEAPLATPRAT
jgi:hypothetical protein